MTEEVNRVTEVQKILLGLSYDYTVFNKGYEEYEDLITDDEIELIGMYLSKKIKLSEEHLEDIRRRMEEAVPTSDGMSFEQIVRALTQR